MIRVDLTFKKHVPNVNFLLVGDSILSHNSVSWAESALTALGYSFLNAWVGNQDAKAFNDQFNSIDWTNTIQQNSITHIIVAHGFADINFLDAIATMNNCNQIYSKFKAIDSSLKVYKTTISPSSTSTDGWATAQNQSVHPGDPEWDSWQGQRDILNNLIRSNTVFDGIVDIAAHIEVDSTNTLTVNGKLFLTNGTPNWPTSDDVHLNAGIANHLANEIQPNILNLVGG